jgi:hypothetical protein
MEDLLFPICLGIFALVIVVLIVYSTVKKSKARKEAAMQLPVYEETAPTVVKVEEVTALATAEEVKVKRGRKPKVAKEAVSKEKKVRKPRSKKA